MDTFKDRQRLEEMHVAGRAPWEIWRDRNAPASARAPRLPSTTPVSA